MLFSCEFSKRRPIVVLPLALVLLAPSLGFAQPLQSFEDLALRVNLDDRLRIEDHSGLRATGRLRGLTREEVVIQTDAGEKRFPSATVHEIAVRRNTRRKGILIGAGVGAAIGALAGCWGPDRQECADGPILLGGVGAGVGLVLGTLVVRSTSVYSSPNGMASSGGVARPQGPFDELALRVNLDDRLRVKDVSGARFSGRLTRLTGDEMTIETKAGEQRLTSAMVREVAVRGYPLGKGALIGAGAFAILVAAAPACRSGGDCNPIAAASFGAGVGLAVAALVPGMTTVFRAQKKQASLSPEFSRSTIGVRASLRW
jgi:hypothetical protein